MGQLKQDMNDVELVAVSMRVEDVVAGGLARLLRELAKSLGNVDHQRVIAMPPLIATLDALPRRVAAVGLRRVREALLRVRPLRSGLLRFVYPDTSRQHLPWLISHDRVVRTVRETLGRFAQRTGSYVLAGTAIHDHPRRHWELWPYDGHVFHMGWCLDPEGVPCACMRHEEPDWDVLEGLELGRGATIGEVSWQVAKRQVELLWENTEFGAYDAPLAWLPRATFTPDSGRCLSSLVNAVEGTAAVASHLSGRLGRPLRGQSWIARRRGGIVEVAFAPPPSRSSPITWVVSPAR